MTLDLDLVPMGTASGTVLDERDQPLAGRGVELVFKEPDFMDMIVIDSTTCDEKGRFKFDAVPSQLRVSLYSGEPASARSPPLTKRTNEFHIDAIESIYLETSEKRTGVRLVAEPPSSTESTAARAATVSARYAAQAADSRLASGQHATSRRPGGGRFEKC